MPSLFRVVVILLLVGVTLFNVSIYLLNTKSNTECIPENNNEEQAEALVQNVVAALPSPILSSHRPAAPAPIPSPSPIPAAPIPSIQPPEEFSGPVEYFLFATVPDNLRYHQKNAIRSWVVLDPPPRRIILFCNNKTVTEEIFSMSGIQARRNLIVVLPVPKETEPRDGKKYPFLDSIFTGALEYVKLAYNKKKSHEQSDYFLVYTNGDIIFTQSFARTMIKLEEIRKQKSSQDIFGIGRRFNLELGNVEIDFKLHYAGMKEVDDMLQRNRKEKGKLFPDYAQDVFVYTPRTFSYHFVPQKYSDEQPYLNDEGIAIPNFVVASVAWDNWLNGYAASRHRIAGIDISLSAIFIHHNHGDLMGSHQNPWTSHNQNIFYPHGIGGFGRLTTLPFILSKEGELKKKAVGQEQPLSDYADS